MSINNNIDFSYPKRCGACRTLKQMRYCNSPTTRNPYSQSTGESTGYQYQQPNHQGFVNYSYEDSNNTQQYQSSKPSSQSHQQSHQQNLSTIMPSTIWYSPMMTPSPLPSSAAMMPNTLGTLGYPTVGLAPGTMKTVCPYFLKGSCRYGDMCHNIHTSIPATTDMCHNIHTSIPATTTPLNTASSDTNISTTSTITTQTTPPTTSTSNAYSPDRSMSAQTDTSRTTTQNNIHDYTDTSGTTTQNGVRGYQSDIFLQYVPGFLNTLNTAPANWVCTHYSYDI